MQLAQRPKLGSGSRTDGQFDDSTMTPRGQAGAEGPTATREGQASTGAAAGSGGRREVRPLYTAEERERRDRSKWTLVQGVLAALQFFVFAASLVLVLRTLLTGEGLVAANVSVVAKTMTLYAIMVTGALWEHDVYGKYLFADAFFWEDVVSMGVIALHTAYLVALATDALEPRSLMLLALAAYATYVVNAGQFLVKFRRARLDRKTNLSNADGAASAMTGSPAAEGAR